MEKILPLSEAKARLNQLVDDVVTKDDEFIITKNGKTAAVLVSVELYEGWRETEEIQKDPEFLKEIKKGVENLRKKKRRYTFEDIFGERLD
jgi:antitoxin YefM